MNYKSLYTHRTLASEEGKNTNQIIRHKSILPPESQKLSEAAIICLDDLTVQVVEKKSVRPMACPQCGKCAEACEHGAITQNAKGVYMVNKKQCTGCGKCVEACPFGLMVKAEESPTASKCIACGKCANACPMDVLEVVEA